MKLQRLAVVITDADVSGMAPALHPTACCVIRACDNTVEVLLNELTLRRAIACIETDRAARQARDKASFKQNKSCTESID